jgi:penicillin-binding protein 2
LSGINGEELVEVDSAGEKIRTLGSKDPIDGNDLKTNIDYNLQIFVSDLLEGEKGAIIITDPKGEVLALYSSPSYNPNIFIKKDSEKIDNVFNDSDLPLFNRAIGGKFPPGSIFKPLVAIAALEEEKIDKDYMYEDTGQITFNTPYGDFSYRNWYYTQYGGVEGKIKLPKAIARSTDTFFYKVGELLGVDNLVDWSGKFGLNEKTGIDLPGEVEGLVPSPEWKEQVKGERWFLGNTYHMSIGQGDLAVTPIAMNTAIASIASGGNMCTPSIAKDVNCKSIDIEKENIDLVKEGMVLACSEGGTAYPFFNFDEEVACKTGTAQIGNSEETHAWFSVFSPVEDPEVVITILVEEGGEGSSKAAPIARKILDYWYDKPISTPVPTISSE